MDRKRHKGVDQRLHINCLNIVFTLVVLITANSLVQGHFSDRINKISKDLNRSLGIALDIQVPNYTSIFENVTYVSTTAINSRGMAVLYNVTTKFMDLIIDPKNIYPEGVIKIHGGQLELGTLEEQLQAVLTHYGALLAVLIVLLLFAILMPLCGFCFCCCRSCGKCGARSKPFDKKGDLCKKICLSTLLICVGTLLIFGIVCAFVTNQALQDHTSELSPTFKDSIKDTDSYLKYTGHQINVLLTRNYKEFEDHLFSTLNKCSDMVSEQLEEYSNATSLIEVIKIVHGLDDVKSNLTSIKQNTQSLQTDASQLVDGLRKVKRDLLVILNDCSGIPDCEVVYNEYINRLGSNIHFDKLPDITSELNNLDAVLGSDLQKAIHDGEKALINIRTQINQTVNSELPKVRDAVGKIGINIIKYGANITSVITRARDSLHEYADPPIKEMDNYLKEYSPYRYYLGIALSCILLLVCICITLGLICGICGKRPDAYGDDCCNKGAGSRFLMMGVAIMFLFSIVLATVAAVYFITGILAQRLACDSLRNPKGSQVIALLDQAVDLKRTIGVDVNISTVITSIHSNKSIYYTFDLKHFFDLNEVEEYINKFDIDKMLKQLKDKINVDTSNIKLLDKRVKERLEELINSNIDHIPYDQFIDELQQSLTTVDLTFLAGKLEEIVKKVNIHYPQRNDISAGLLLSSLHLRTYHENLVTPMKQKTNELIASVTMLNNSFSSAIIKNLVEELENAERYLKINGTHDMIEIAGNFANGLEKQVNSYLDRTVLHVKDHVGVSAPISHMVNATLVATCDKILLPWNGFWFSILWCLILFIPAIILSVKLAGLYQKYEAYPGPLVEASRSDKRHKKKKQKRLDGRGAYVAEPSHDHAVSREMPSGSARYADMAPKHWEEFPAGGPPHYQRAPTEYERPPPYYYPSTEERQ